MLFLILNSIITHAVCGLALPEGLNWFGNGHDSCICLSLGCYEDFLGDIVCTCRTFICDLAFSLKGLGNRFGCIVCLGLVLRLS